MVNSIEELMDSSQTIIIGNNAPEFECVLDSARDDQAIIDLVRIRSKLPELKEYEGICW